MDFNPNQMREDALIKKGRYYFRVLEGREKRSSTGNDMMNLRLVIEVNGKEIKFFDNLILIPKMFWKVEHFCATTGMLDKLEAGRIMAQDCDGKEGFLEIDHRVNKETGVIEDYVKDYIKPEEPETADEDFFNDEIKI